jgi:hypothetical protein
MQILTVFIMFVCLWPHEQFFSYLVTVTIAGDRAANLSLCSALRAFEQGGIIIVPHLLRHGTSVYTVSSERPAPTSHSHQIFAPDALTTAPRGRLCFYYDISNGHTEYEFQILSCKWDISLKNPHVCKQGTSLIVDTIQKQIAY